MGARVAQSQPTPCPTQGLPGEVTTPLSTSVLPSARVSGPEGLVSDSQGASRPGREPLLHPSEDQGSGLQACPRLPV